MRIEEVHRVLVIGAGTMGQQIGLQCAWHGYTVVLYDIAPKMLDNATAQIKAYATQLVAGGFLTPAEANATLSRMTMSSRPEEAADQADLISECVPEDPELKGRVFAQFNKLCSPRTIFTTNTSTLLPSMFAAATGRPAQFAALHFHKTVWVSNVVDVMPHQGTSEETVTLLLDFAKRIGQIPILLKKEKSSYVFNSMFNAINREAMALVVDGFASVEDVDRAWMGIMKMPIGPFGMLDDVGLDTAWHITNFWAKTLHLSELQRQADFLKQYVDKGKLGVKSGQGFYTYPNPAFQRRGFVEGTERKG